MGDPYALRFALAIFCLFAALVVALLLWNPSAWFVSFIFGIIGLIFCPSKP